MIKIFKSAQDVQIFARNTQASDDADRIAAAIIDDVQANGDEALLKYCRRFDCPGLTGLEVSKQEIEDACGMVDEDFYRVLRRAAANITAFHERQKRDGFRMESDGAVLGQRVIPLQRVGVYVPGGTASYPSTVLMNIIPAKIAGVDEVIMATPPDKNGSIAPEILCAAKLAGADRIFKMGGAQAVAALAMGTETVPAVDKIVGPGNIFVAAAKRRVFGKVAIDMIAGPSEILIIADCGEPRVIAADMLSQAEHDKNASAVLICTDSALAYSVSQELEKQIPNLSRAEIARASVDNNGKIIIVDSIAEAVEISNRIAPEHLEIMTENPFAVLDGIRSAGSVFLGLNAPEALGDYMAGPNHTLPTGGTARFSSPLSVDDFCKRSSYVWYSREKLKGTYKDIAVFARAEGLQAHALSAEARFKNDDN